MTLARRKVLVQELPAVEVLARVDMLCLDKTGTLTSGAVELDHIESCLGSACADGDGGSPPLAKLVPTPPLGVALGLAPSSRPVPTTPLGPPWPIWWVAVRLTLPAALSLLD